MNVFISRLIGSLVTGAATWLAAKFVFFQFLLEPENLAAAIGLCAAFAHAVYSVVHRTLDKKFNPADTAKAPELAAAKIGEGTV